MVYEPGLIWVIAGVAQGKVAAVRAWRFDGGAFAEIMIAAS